MNVSFLVQYCSWSSPHLLQDDHRHGLCYAFSRLYHRHGFFSPASPGARDLAHYVVQKVQSSKKPRSGNGKPKVLATSSGKAELLRTDQFTGSRFARY